MEDLESQGRGRGRHGIAALAVLGFAALAGCSSIEREMQPVTDSLNTPAMNAAIEEARRMAPPG